MGILKDESKYCPHCEAFHTDHEPHIMRSDFTYPSKQATHCAVCGELKHTPLRNDEMGGYVCLTCIDRELERLQKLHHPTFPPGCP